jgi:hypothetical protein
MGQMKTQLCSALLRWVDNAVQSTSYCKEFRKIECRVSMQTNRGALQQIGIFTARKVLKHLFASC